MLFVTKQSMLLSVYRNASVMIKPFLVIHVFHWLCCYVCRLSHLLYQVLLWRIVIPVGRKYTPLSILSSMLPVCNILAATASIMQVSTDCLCIFSGGIQSITECSCWLCMLIMLIFSYCKLSHSRLMVNFIVPPPSSYTHSWYNSQRCHNGVEVNIWKLLDTIMIMPNQSVHNAESFIHYHNNNTLYIIAFTHH